MKTGCCVGAVPPPLLGVTLVELLAAACPSRIPLRHQGVRWPLVEREEHRQVIAQMAREQEMFAHEVVPEASHALALVRVTQQASDAIIPAPWPVDPEASLVVRDLQADTATGAP